jgi:mevalonate pyrophosphate decarboxylase
MLASFLPSAPAAAAAARVVVKCRILSLSADVLSDAARSGSNGAGCRDAEDDVEDDDVEEEDVGVGAVSIEEEEGDEDVKTEVEDGGKSATRPPLSSGMCSMVCG